MKAKKYLTLCSCVLAFCLISGCSSESSETVTDNSENEKITLEAYVWNDEETNIELLADAYMEKNPDIEVHVNVIPITEFGQRMLGLKNGQFQADCIFSPSIAESSVWKNKKMLKDFSEYLEGTDLTDHYEQWYEDGEEDNAAYMLPYKKSRWAVYYNKNIFDAMGVDYPGEDWTWEEYADMAKRLTGNVNGKKVYGSMSYEPTSKWWRVPARTAGAENPLVYSDLEELKKSAEYIYDLTYTLKAQRPYTQQNGDYSYAYNEAFLNGTTAMYFCGDWSAAVLNRNIADKNLDFSYDIAPMPHWKGKESYVISDAAVVSMVATTVHPDETFDFMKFAAGEEGAHVLAQNDVIPAWNSDEIKEEYLNCAALPEHREYFWREGEISRVPCNVSYTEAMEIVKDEVANYLLQKQSLEAAFSRIEEALEKL